jgi:putative nucleotidyltransferase with HDIG domain
MKAQLGQLFANGRGGAVIQLVQSTDAASAQIDHGPSTSLNLRSGLYVGFVSLIAVFAFAWYVPELSTADWKGFVTLIALAVVLERVGLQIYGDTDVSAGVVPLFALAILYGPVGVVIAAPLVVLAAEAFTSSAWYRRLFNMGAYTLANLSTALLFPLIAVGADGSPNVSWLLAGAISVSANYAINVGLVDIAVSLDTKRRLWDVWLELDSWLFPYYIVFGLLGLALAAAYLALGVTGIMAFAAPPLMMRVAMHQYVSKTEKTVMELQHKNTELETANRDILQMTQELTETYDGTLEALVLALDARDHETKGHSFRVATYAMTIARQLGMKEGTQQWIDMQRGALLHDVGKIGVPDFILHKPGPLTPEEWTDMKRHPRIGHEMLRDISFLSGAAAIVHAHHERFDGKGYPLGLAGDDIPLGARIFTIADSFDAMTSDRPYRKALTSEAAWQEVLKHSGTQFDPQVVQAFLAVFDKLLELSRLDRDQDEHALAA